MTAYIEHIHLRPAQDGEPAAATVGVKSNTSDRKISDRVGSEPGMSDSDLLKAATWQARRLCKVLDLIDHGPLKDPNNAIVWTGDQYQARLQEARKAGAEAAKEEDK